MLLGKPEWNRLTAKILDCCRAVHSELGPGPLESVYEECLGVEFGLCGMNYLRQSSVAIRYKGVVVPEAFRLDFLVENLIVVELKAVERINPVHAAQVLSYLRVTGKPIGLLVNFHTAILKDGVRRFINLPEEYRSPPATAVEIPEFEPS